MKYVQLFLLVLLATFSYSLAFAGVSSAVEKAAISEIAKSVAKKTVKEAATSTPVRVVGRTAGGSSAVLGLNIGIKKTGEWAAHHIIPVQLKEHRVLKAIGMHMDEVANGIALPRRPGVDPTLPLHSGSHPSYTAAVAKQLDSIPVDLSLTEMESRVKQIQHFFRRELESGRPLHKQFGATDPWLQ